MNVSRIRRIKNRLNLVNFPIKLEIGCGKKVSSEWHGLDIEDYGQDFLWDVENGLPFPDNSCTEIYSSHTFEHIDDLIGLMNECWRVLRSKGELYIVVPSRVGEKAYVPSHVRFFDEWSFKFFQYEDYTNDYHSKAWDINELVTNERKDIHVKMSPKGK